MDSRGSGMIRLDPYLRPFAGAISARMGHYEDTKQRLLGGNGQLSELANGYLYFGFHRQGGSLVFRDWAPGADEVYLMGDFNNWDKTSHPLNKLENGIWETTFKGEHGTRVLLHMVKGGQHFTRIPLYCHRVVQDAADGRFFGQVWNPEPYIWQDDGFVPDKSKPPLIYEAHAGMASEEERIATFPEFREAVLPRISELGYNTLQLMAVMEHPYYASFGYQVTNFFAVSSRFGTPEDLKALIDAAHRQGIAVLLDVVHAHAASNTAEGIAKYDGTDYQFFHAGSRGTHPQWNTKLFDFGKPQVLHFLLSNLKYWMEEYHFDGFRFDGVTSMLYKDHGINTTFGDYRKYFSDNTDLDALAYLQLATTLCREVKPGCILVAEEVSGMPGMCLPVEDGGTGFDYRLGMGLPDYWIRFLQKRDQDWNMQELFREVSQRRPGEKVIAYCESHDQALVGDKTIMFRLADKEMYRHMDRASNSAIIDRAVALHKMIRLVTLAAGGEGYLNFMGNEFGHPEWIDFPREGNGWSHFYARRQWSLAGNRYLRYSQLLAFDRAMIAAGIELGLLVHGAQLLLADNGRKLLAFRCGQSLLAFNFHLRKEYVVHLPLSGTNTWTCALHTGWEEFGGVIRRAGLLYRPVGGILDIPVPSRTGLLLDGR